MVAKLNNYGAVFGHVNMLAHVALTIYFPQASIVAVANNSVPYTVMQTNTIARSTTRQQAAKNYSASIPKSWHPKCKNSDDEIFKFSFVFLLIRKGHMALDIQQLLFRS